MAVDVNQSLSTDGDEDVATPAGASMATAEVPRVPQYVESSGSTDATAREGTAVDAALSTCEAHASAGASGVAVHAHERVDVDTAEVVADDCAAAVYVAAYVS
jgi:hypothetical protein